MNATISSCFFPSLFEVEHSICSISTHPTQTFSLVSAENGTIMRPLILEFHVFYIRSHRATLRSSGMPENRSARIVHTCEGAKRKVWSAWRKRNRSYRTRDLTPVEREAQEIDMDYGPARASQSQPELFLTECDMLVDCS